MYVLVASLLLSAALRGSGLVARALLRADLFEKMQSTCFPAPPLPILRPDPNLTSRVGVQNFKVNCLQHGIVTDISCM